VVHIFEFQPAPGVKVSRIASLEDDLALAMESQAVRIVAPIPGRNVVGIEIPNRERETVYLRPLLESREFRDPRYRLPVALGKDVSGKPVIYDLTSMPHLLMAGATGSGKSVGINTIILSLLFRHTPETVRLYLVDPKRLELTPYQGIPHLEGHEVVTDHEQALALFKALVRKMEERYTLLEGARVRNIESYNEKNPRSPLPYLVCIVDELSDLMMVTRKAIEEPIARLAQMARAAGIHLVLATQRPSVDVITGLIKANFPSRIAFRVSSKADSRVILDSVGAETLLGRGDMLFKPPTTDIPIRVHGAFVSEEEVMKVVEYLKEGAQKVPETPVITREEIEAVLDELRGEREGLSRDAEEINDELLERAIEIGRTEGVISTSRLQRVLGIGYNRAARLMDALEARGMVGPQESAGKPRKFIAR
jgi:S-DNA-T family DNA segregation ATPase FtsK/SpoIIIE